MEFRDKAVERLEGGLKEFKGNKYAQAVRHEVFERLCDFCRQDEEFAQAVVQGQGTFSGCCEAVVNGVSGSISDLEAYKRAVSFYFPGASVSMQLSIDLCGSAAEAQDKPRGIILDISDFL